MNLKDYLLFGLMIGIVGGFFWYDHKVSSLEEKLAKAEGVKPDTVQVVLTIHDTTFVSVADTVIQHSDTTINGDTVTVNHWPVLVDNTSQPLFDLRVKVDSKNSLFDYAYKYKPLTLTFKFADKYDLRKGFELSLDPNIGNVSVNWGQYEPLKKPKGFELSAGFGYSDVTGHSGVLLMGGIKWKKNELGITLRDGGKDYFYKRTLLSF